MLNLRNKIILLQLLLMVIVAKPTASAQSDAENKNIFAQAESYYIYEEYESFSKYITPIPMRNEDNSYTPIPQDYMDMTGWKELAELASVAYNKLDSTQKKDCIFYANDYGQAGAMDFYGKKYHLPAPVCASDSYIFWAPDSLTASNFIISDSHLGDIPRLFNNYIEIGEIKNIYFRENGLKTSQRSFYRIKWKKPLIWTRILNICGFFTTAFIFFFIRWDNGTISGIKFEPWFLNMDLDIHYKYIWLYDTTGAVLLGLLLERRWACRNLCFMGALCASGASISRLIPVVDSEKCNLCGKCETDCLVRIPIRDYVTNNNGLVTNSECLICGKCIESCKPEALKIKFIWNRNKYVKKHSFQSPPITSQA